MAANLRCRLRGGAEHQFRFVTLTLRHSASPLRNQVARLHRCFRRLRSRPVWSSVRGGMVVLEVKWSSQHRRWHPHLHVVVEGGWIDAAELSRQWLRVTGDSSIVDVRSLRRGRDVAGYLAKYVSKGINHDCWIDVDASQEWITATRGLRVASTIGSWRGWRLNAVSQEANDWEPVGWLTRIIVEAERGAAWAVGVLLSLRPPGGDQDRHREPHTGPPPSLFTRPT